MKKVQTISGVNVKRINTIDQIFLNINGAINDIVRVEVYRSDDPPLTVVMATTKDGESFECTRANSKSLMIVDDNDKVL